MTAKILNILIADDDEEDLELIEEAIANADCQAKLYKVKDGKAVIEFLTEKKDQEFPDLIILDYNMPELNGSEVLQQIRSQQRYMKIPVVVMSTSNAAIHQHECKTNGATEYFVKPNTMRELNALAKEMLTFCRSN